MHWQLHTPISAIVFDCDGTLSFIEGINELAKGNGVTEAVEALTAQAMSDTGINPSIYQDRLSLVLPRQEQVLALGETYFTNKVPDVYAVIDIFNRLDKTIYLLSAGLYPAVKIFGEMLNIPADNIYAVDIHFDADGQFVDFDRQSPLVQNDGKRSIIQLLKYEHAHIAHVGDGLNDLITQDIVTRFIGYGGAFYRDNIAKQCDYYIKSASLCPLLPLCLTTEEIESLNPEDFRLYRQGVEYLRGTQSG